MVASGVASTIYPNDIAAHGHPDEFVNYSKYSRVSSEGQTYEYANTILDLTTCGPFDLMIVSTSLSSATSRRPLDMDGGLGTYSSDVVPSQVSRKLSTDAKHKRHSLQCSQCSSRARQWYRFDQTAPPGLVAAAAEMKDNVKEKVKEQRTSTMAEVQIMGKPRQDDPKDYVYSNVKKVGQSLFMSMLRRH